MYARGRNFLLEEITDSYMWHVYRIVGTKAFIASDSFGSALEALLIYSHAELDVALIYCSMLRSESGFSINEAVKSDSLVDVTIEGFPHNGLLPKTTESTGIMVPMTTEAGIPALLCSTAAGEQPFLAD